MMIKFHASLILILLPILVSSECTCETKGQGQGQDQGKTHEALRYKLIAIASILVAGAPGVSLPFLAKNIPCLHPDRDVYFLVKAFAAGVILATGFIHILPDAFESLTSPCLGDEPWGSFPFAGFVAMVSAIGTLMMEAFATGYHKRSELSKPQPVNGDGDEVESGGTFLGGHVHGSGLATSSSDLVRNRVTSQILELGIVVHSVIIGVSLGASQSPKTIKPLVAALSFHQFFEGMGLGGCIFQAKFKKRAIAIMVMFFSMTTPTGIAVGIGISRVYNEKSPTALIVQGLLNSASAGILIYMALVNLLANDFMSTKLQTHLNLQLGANFALLLGASSMSLLATTA